MNGNDHLEEPRVIPWLKPKVAPLTLGELFGQLTHFQCSQDIFFNIKVQLQSAEAGHRAALPISCYCLRSDACRTAAM